MPDALKIALIGTGGWGRQHARVLAGRPDVDFCAVLGRDPARTAARAAEFGTRPYTDLLAMLDAERPDLAFVCLPNQGHFDVTRQLIEAGVPLLVEKPLVFNLAEADALLDAAAARNLFFAINFNHRYAEPAVMAKAAIDAGRLGQLTFATWRFGGEGNGDHPHANLIETQCHGFDLLEHLCGPIASVMAQMADATGKGFSTMSVALKFGGGAVGNLLGSYDSSYAYPGTQRVEINGTEGRIAMEDTVRRYTFHPAGSEVGEAWEAGYFNDRDRSFERTFDAHAEAVLAAFRAGEEPPVHARAGRRALEVARACIESFESGRRVMV